MRMEVRNPKYRERVALIFNRANFLRDLGVRLGDIGPGWAVTELDVQERHLQQNGFVHAGVQATMADHTAGCAAASMIGPDEYVMTVEFKVNFLRPAAAGRLRCKAAVLKPGKTLSVVESEVYAPGADGEVLASKATVTLAVLTGAGW
jgi:uncharacterized protein (TIGR00369 family)